MARFEALAGRSAMIGFFAALGIEAFSESSVFAIPSDQYTLVAAAFAASIGAAAALAAARGAGLASAGGGGAAADGAHLLEAVVSSLTASARSASGVTQLKVDEVRASRPLGGARGSTRRGARPPAPALRAAAPPSARRGPASLRAPPRASAAPSTAPDAKPTNPTRPDPLQTPTHYLTSGR